MARSLTRRPLPAERGAPPVPRRPRTGQAGLPHGQVPWPRKLGDEQAHRVGRAVLIGVHAKSGAADALAVILNRPRVSAGIRRPAGGGGQMLAGLAGVVVVVLGFLSIPFISRIGEKAKVKEQEIELSILPKEQIK